MSNIESEGRDPLQQEKKNTGTKIEKRVEIPIPTGPETITYKGKIIEVVVQNMQIGEKIVPFERARRSPGTRLLITSDTGKILLTREYRSEVGGYDYRLPGGKVFDTLDEFNQSLQKGEDIIAKSKVAAQKEAHEEVGMDTDDINHFYTSKCGATVEWDLHYFTVNVPTEQLGEQDLEAGENIEVGWYSCEQAMELALNGSLNEDRSAAVLMRYIHTKRQNPITGEEIKEDHDGAGRKLAESLKGSGLDSLRIRTENLVQLRDIKSIIVVGSSSVGKSTIVDAIRNAIEQDRELAARLSIPKRVITRPQRENDNLAENTFKKPEEFTSMIEDGEIGLRWVRKMEGTRTESYGFLKPEEGIIPVYSANNAIISNKESVEPGEMLEKSLIIAIYAPDNVREERLVKRSPDLVAQKIEEVRYRLADRAINMYPHAHIVVKNFGRYEGRTREDIVALMRMIVKGA